LSKYQTTNKLDNSQLLLVANLTNDNLVDNADLQGLIVPLANSGGNGGGSLSAVPEPRSVATLALGGLLVLRWTGLRTTGEPQARTKRAARGSRSAQRRQSPYFLERFAAALL
jgi:hypothetical protein